MPREFVVKEEGYEDEALPDKKTTETDTAGIKKTDTRTTKEQADNSVPVVIGGKTEGRSLLNRFKEAKDQLPTSREELFDSAVGTKNSLKEAGKAAFETSGSAMKYLKEIGGEFHFSKWEIIGMSKAVLFTGQPEAALIPFLQQHGSEFSKMFEIISNDAKNKSPVAIALLENIKQQLGQASGNPIVKKFIDDHGVEIASALKEKASETKNVGKAVRIVQKTADNPIVKKGLIPIAKHFWGKKK